jgi:hypothetical protein
LKHSGTPNEFKRRLGIFDSRQIHSHPVRSLGLYLRFDDTVLVDPIAEDRYQLVYSLARHGIFRSTNGPQDYTRAAAEVQAKLHAVRDRENHNHGGNNYHRYDNKSNFIPLRHRSNASTQ